MQHTTYTYTYNTPIYIYRLRRLNNDSIAHYTSHSPYNTSPTNIHYITTTHLRLGFPTPLFLQPTSTQLNTTQHNHTHTQHIELTLHTLDQAGSPQSHSLLLPLT